MTTASVRPESDARKRTKQSTSLQAGPALHNLATRRGGHARGYDHNSEARKKIGYARHKCAAPTDTNLTGGENMAEFIKPEDIYDKNLNFLLGSGASFGLFPTLALNIRGGDGKPHTVETLATSFEESDSRFTLVFMHYYLTCIKPVIEFNLEAAEADQNKRVVIDNYATFVETALQILQRRKPMEKRCNVFTTNYDGCIAHVADSLFKRANIDFVLNDGARGFHRRFLQARNYNSFLCQTGVFERHTSGIPQINLIHLHGSVYWYKEDTRIKIDYAQRPVGDIMSEETVAKLAPFSACLDAEEQTVADLPHIELSDAEKRSFWGAYQKLPIVNPTKWKFHETVFEEHYYQMLRLLSYELEKPNAVLVTFGFSFADEHILNLVQRSLSNPYLQVFVCCFNQAGADRMKMHFGSYRNVQCVSIGDGQLDFTAFNEKVLHLNSHPEPVLGVAAAADEAAQ